MEIFRAGPGPQKQYLGPVSRGKNTHMKKVLTYNFVSGAIYFYVTYVLWVISDGEHDSGIHFILP